MHDQELYDKLIARIRKEDSGCWVWIKYRHPYGYGMFCTKRKNMNSHRAMWIAIHGPLTKQQFVCHKCDNPPCINPDHLFIGALADNNRDMASKGRYNHQKRTHCIHGHEFTAENTYRPPARPTKRICRTCQRIIQGLTPEQRAARKLYDGSVRRSPKRLHNKFSVRSPPQDCKP
ncbi:MAG: HNH endonuclease [Terriglobales bacterium]